jgi:hypothetical protein
VERLAPTVADEVSTGIAARQVERLAPIVADEDLAELVAQWEAAS